MTARLARVLGSGILILLLVAGMAGADGDPASDVLRAQSVFYPYTPPVSAALQKQLEAETASASRAHFPIKVALIASPSDLGAIPSLFGSPQRYASFLGQEISYRTKQALLVVMPGGYGVAGVSRAGRIAVTSLRKPTGSQSNDLARAATVAVAKLAAAAGHPIDTAATNGGSAAVPGGGSRTSLLAALVLAALLTAAGLIVAKRRRVTRRWANELRRGAAGRAGWRSRR